MGAATIIAVDVGLAEDTSPVIYGDTLSGWFILFQVNRLLMNVNDETQEIESIFILHWI